MRLRVLITGIAMLAATPALAQMTGTTATGADGGTGAMGTPDTSMMTCQQMMDSTQPKVMAMADGDQKSMAMHQMKMANDAMGMHHEKSCKTHMKKIMDMM